MVLGKRGRAVRGGVGGRRGGRGGRGGGGDNEVVRVAFFVSSGGRRIEEKGDKMKYVKQGTTIYINLGLK